MSSEIRDIEGSGMVVETKAQSQVEKEVVGEGWKERAIRAAQHDEEVLFKAKKVAQNIEREIEELRERAGKEGVDVSALLGAKRSRLEFVQGQLRGLETAVQQSRERVAHLPIPIDTPAPSVALGYQTPFQASSMTTMATPQRVKPNPKPSQVTKAPSTAVLTDAGYVLKPYDRSQKLAKLGVNPVPAAPMIPQPPTVDITGDDVEEGSVMCSNSGTDSDSDSDTSSSSSSSSTSSEESCATPKQAPTPPPIVVHASEERDNPLQGEVNKVAKILLKYTVIDDGTIGTYRTRLKNWKEARKKVKRDVRLREQAAKKINEVHTQADDGDDDEFSPDEDSADYGPAEADVVADDEEEEEIVFQGSKRCTDKLRLAASTWDSLFKYQQTSVKWLWELHTQQVGGIIGDEMGLGKTVQVITFLGGLQRSKLLKRPVLIVCPATLMTQWIREFHKWAPEMRVVALHATSTWSGSKQSLLRSLDLDKSAVITTYSGMVSESKLLAEYGFHYVVLDEGHHIRNHNSQAAKAVKQFPTPHRIVLSGSPLQNRLSEMWSLFDFVYPGKLGDLGTFMRTFEVPINTGGFQFASPQQIATAYSCCVKLRELTMPYLLRRVKKDVLELPKKTETVLFCKLSIPQVVAYAEYLQSDEMKHVFEAQQDAHAKRSRSDSLKYNSDARNADMDDFLRRAKQAKQTGKQLPALAAIQTLRKICNHPQLYKNTGGVLDVDCSAKLKVVKYLLPKWKEGGHKCLIFSQSRPMLDILETVMNAAGYTYVRMDGNTPVAARLPLIDKFNRTPEVFAALLTPKVGGLGLNMTAADRVLIYDPDWNPVTDIQARERSWRIGQKREVAIYRLVTTGTIEEKIYQRQVFKSHLTDRVLNDPKQNKLFDATSMKSLYTLSTEYKNMYKQYLIDQAKLKRSYAAAISDDDSLATPPRRQLPPRIQQRYNAKDVIHKKENIVETSWGFEPAGEGDKPAEDIMQTSSTPQKKSTIRGESNSPPKTGGRTVMLAEYDTSKHHKQMESAGQQDNVDMMRSVMDGVTVPMGAGYKQAMHRHGDQIRKEAARVANEAEKELRRSQVRMKSASRKRKHEEAEDVQVEKQKKVRTGTPPPKVPKAMSQKQIETKNKEDISNLEQVATRHYSVSTPKEVIATLEDQMRVHLGESELTTPTILETFKGMIGNGEGLVTLGMFRASLSKVATFSKTAGTWKLRPRQSMDF